MTIGRGPIYRPDARPEGRIPGELIREMRTAVMIHLGQDGDLGAVK
jgi:hypothetical protein